MLKRAIALSVSIFMLLTSVVCMPLEASAANVSDDTELTRAIYPAYDRAPITFVYTDDYFRGDSEPFNNSLATTSFIASLATYANAKDPDLSKQTDVIRDMLEDNGFSDYEANGDYFIKPSSETAPVGCAYKKINDDGKEYTLLAIFPRSGTYGEEFGRNMVQSESASDRGDHAGYRMRADKVRTFVQSYVQKHGLKGDMKVWISGYSGAGGTSDLIAAELIRDPKPILGSEASLDPHDLYAYIYTGMRVAAVEGDHASVDDFDIIHNVYDPGDFLSSIPPEESFVRYGRTYILSEIGDKDRVLELLKIDSFGTLDLSEYYKQMDPADYTPYKLDTEAILKGQLKLLPDEDSYLPDNIGDYLDSVTSSMSQLTAKSSASGNAREGYYTTYQAPVENFINYMFNNGTGKSMKFVNRLISESDTSIPMIVTMYMTVLTEKSKSNHSEVLNESFEGAFNYLASQMENSDGSINAKYRLSKRSYELLKKTFFVEDESGEQLYRLKKSIDLKNTSLMLSLLKTLRNRLYASTMRQILEADGADAATISTMTGEKDSAAMSEFIGNMMFVNVLQDKKVEPFSFDNQQFKQLATLYGNMSRLMTNHSYFNIIEWLRSADPNYDSSYKFASGAEAVGYRRVYINTENGAALSGNVKDASGQIVALFEDGKIVYRTSEWIGITKSDSGCWLRLPLDEEYIVNIDTRSSVNADLRIEEVASMKSTVARTVDSDSRYDWRGIALTKGERVSLKLPAIEATAGEKGETYELPSQTEYSMSRPDHALPALKGVKAKAGKRSMKVSWTKLNAEKQRETSGIEVQYSTNKKFKKAAVKTRSVSNNAGTVRIKGLKKNRVYYVRVRSVSKYDGSKFVSKWSAVRKAKVK